MILMSDVLRYTLGIILVVILVGIFIFSYLLNKRTKAPDGCRKLDCGGCHMVDCHNHPTHKENEEEKIEDQKGEK